MIGSQTAARDDAVHMDVVIQLLVPGMEDLDDAGSCAEELMVCGKFQERIGTASMEEAIKERLIAIKQGVEFMGQGKNDMEVRGIDDFGTPPIHPDFLIDSLAVRAVTVSAGIIVDFGISAVGTDREIAAKPAGFTV